MAKVPSPRAADAASIATRVLAAWKSGHKGACAKELARALELCRSLHPPETLEAERLEILTGAIESLGASRPEQVQAAIHLLEHLAHPSGRR
jgi:hypothetical protein